MFTSGQFHKLFPDLEIAFKNKNVTKITFEIVHFKSEGVIKIISKINNFESYFRILKLTFEITYYEIGYSE